MIGIVRRSIKNSGTSSSRYYYHISGALLSSKLLYQKRILIGPSFSPITSSQFRSYWNKKDDDDDDDDKKNGDDKKNKDNEETTTKKDHDSNKEPTIEDSTTKSSSSNNDSNATTISTATTSVLPTKLPFGESAPRYPHTLALPLVSRPLFPGTVTSVTLTDETTINAIDNLMRTGNSNDQAYISCFLRAKDSTGVSDNGVILPTPEIITDPNDLYKVGTFAQIQRLTRNVANPKPTDIPDNSNESNTDSNDSNYDDSTAATLILFAHRRVDLKSIDNIGPPIDVSIRHWPRTDYTGDNSSIRALSNEIISTIREVAQMNALFRENLAVFPMRFDANDPYKLADFAACITASGKPIDLQNVLEAKDPELRLLKSLELLHREKEVSKLQKEISAKVEEKMTEAQRKYFLTEQLKSIKKELGMEKDDKDTLIEKFRKQLSKYPGELPKEVQDVINSEIEKFSTLEKNSPEYNVTRSYLDWLVSVPWNVVTDDNFNIQTARQTLDRDHYGLDDVKDTILQFIAIGKLKGNVQGKILCLSGPPGTGKTSIAKSIADSLGRKFYRFSVGGLTDVSEIKGHRRTYIGAMPGKIIQCLKSAGTSNPVVLIDEIDKLGSGYRGDPASALLEVLDPSQNSTFRDHFLDVPVDISKILFLCTANELDRIPGPLLDRMEVIRLSGYDFPEKVKIAEQYLIPKAMKESGLMIDPEEEEEKKKKEEEKKKQSKDEDGKESSDDVVVDTDKKKDEKEEIVKTPLEKFVHSKGVPESLSISIDAIHSLVRWYAREAGVRNLAKYINKICGKLALQVVAEDEGANLTEKTRRKADSWVITEDNLSDYVGKPVFTSDRLYETGTLPNGIVMGLAYTSMGGSALYIETQAIKRGVDSDGKPRGGGAMKVTGQLGDVMQESAQIAYTVARARLAEIDPSSSFFDVNDIHMHVPEGATPKDGPSAGVTATTSMLSLALGKPCNNDVAMTGEISLTGKVLPVGGIKEKIMAARRAGISTVILPSANQRDFDEIPDYLKEGLSVHYADDYQQVYDVAFSESK